MLASSSWAEPYLDLASSGLSSGVHKAPPMGSDCSTQWPTLRETNSRSRVFSTNWSSVEAVNTFPFSSRSIWRISSRRWRNPLPSMQATTSYGRIPAATCLSRCVASTSILATLSRAVPSSLVTFASMTTDGVFSSGIQKSCPFSVGSCSATPPMRELGRNPSATNRHRKRIDNQLRIA